jgi:hypothetical protein
LDGHVEKLEELFLSNKIIGNEHQQVVCNIVWFHFITATVVKD